MQNEELNVQELYDEKIEAVEGGAKSSNGTSYLHCPKCSQKFWYDDGDQNSYAAANMDLANHLSHH